MLLNVAFAVAVEVETVPVEVVGAFELTVP
jgi:hypothetical protein